MCLSVIQSAREKSPVVSYHRKQIFPASDHKILGFKNKRIAPDLARNAVPRILTILLSRWKDAGQLRRSEPAGNSWSDRASLKSPSFGCGNLATQPDACKSA